ncbi:hypothetical protein AVEN_63130-1 [Araneus ventricosus]|uniref:Uncharacterized protein n=1 Tax=Araneus ventricosus TaxID=182803 RepID=A0A4Y2UVM8_ARAVE|nr:hypothetical protein AVEN_63130-1 [Araneus ventricosus]
MSNKRYVAPPGTFQKIEHPPKGIAFTLDFELFYACNTATFIAGKLNAKHGQWNYARSFKLVIGKLDFKKKTGAKTGSLDESTHHYLNRGSVIDQALLRNVPSIYNIKQKIHVSVCLSVTRIPAKR